MQFPKIKTYKKDNSTGLSIQGKSLELYFKQKYRFLQLAGDVLVGIFFVSGSIMNFFDATALYGSIAYLLGSLSLTIRPLLKIIRNTWIYKK